MRLGGNHTPTSTSDTSSVLRVELQLRTCQLVRLVRVVKVVNCEWSCKAWDLSTRTTCTSGTRVNCEWSCKRVLVNSYDSVRVIQGY